MQDTEFWRFADLKARRIVMNWAQLKRLIDGHRFPPGFLLTPGCRVWDHADVEAWVEQRRQAATAARTAANAEAV